MKQNVTAPAIVVGVVLVVLVVYFLGKTFMAPSPTNNGPHKLPSFIDPATMKPYAGHAGGSGAAAPAGTHQPSVPGGQPSAPGGQ
jgi:hypothetical protein